MKFFAYQDVNQVKKWALIKEGKTFLLQGAPWQEYSLLEELSLSKPHYLCPVEPSKIVCVGLNYEEHIVEMKLPRPSEPLLFLKAPSALTPSASPIILPSYSQKVEFEAELGVVMKCEAKNIPPEKISSYILGYTCFNDVTARDIQKKDGQFARAKSFDTFACCGPFIETDLNPENLSIQSRLNGVLKQNSNTSQMIFKVYELISVISHMMTLMPGDLISTGSPGGCAQLNRGDVIEVEIEGIGVLSNSVE